MNYIWMIHAEVRSAGLWFSVGWYFGFLHLLISTICLLIAVMRSITIVKELLSFSEKGFCKIWLVLWYGWIFFFTRIQWRFGMMWLVLVKLHYMVKGVMEGWHWDFLQDGGPSTNLFHIPYFYRISPLPAPLFLIPGLEWQGKALLENVEDNVQALLLPCPRQWEGNWV